MFSQYSAMPSPKTHRLVVLGADRVGKTAIIEQLIFGNHVIGQGGLPTLGDIYEVTIETEKGTLEKLQIFDTPGTLFSSTKNSYEQDHFLSIADGVVLVYEVTSKSSYDMVTSLRQKVAIRNKDLPVVVLGNKFDLNAIREVPTSKAQQWARSHAVRPYEVSVMDRDSLKDPFCYVTWRMANPGKPFSVLPLLTTTTGVLSGSALSRINAHPTDRTSPQRHSNAPATSSEAKPYADDDPSSTYSDEIDSPSASGRSFLQDYPDDAQFPSGKGPLFFADCLSSKNKARFKDHNL